MRSAIDYGFPPFTRAVKTLVYVNIVVALLLFFVRLSDPALAGTVEVLFGLSPRAVASGWLWQAMTYSFLHQGIMHLLLNMLGLWMFGSRLEQDWGRQRFLEFYFFCVVGAALSTIAISYTRILGMSPTAITVGASGGIYGLLIAFGMLYATARVYVFGIFPLQARVFAAIFIALAVFSAVTERGNVNHIAHLGGALFGYIYLKFMPRRGLRFATSESYYGVKNRYQRWKRRRAARKFEVYMRQHDRSKFFDEYGNYRGPSEKDADDQNKGGWVN